MAKLFQPSFAKGEISPSLQGRVDINAYQIALNTAKNMFVHTYGGISNRPGLTFLGPVKDHSYAPRLIPFKFNNQDTYVLEFGDFYMRVIRNDTHVLEPTKTLTAVSETSPAQFTSAGHGFSNGDEVYFNNTNLIVAGRRFVVTAATTNTFQIQNQVTGDPIDGTNFGTFVAGSVARVFTLTTLYDKADLAELKYTQSADVMTLTHSSYPIQELRRMDHDDWSIVEPNFLPTTQSPDGVGVTVNTSGSATDRYQVTAIDKVTAEESLPGISSATEICDAPGTDTITVASGVVTITINGGHDFETGDELHWNVQGGAGSDMEALDNKRYFITKDSSTEFTFEDLDASEFGITDGSKTDTIFFGTTSVRVTTSATTRDNTITYGSEVTLPQGTRYAIYKEKNGVFGLIGNSDTSSFEDDNIDPDTSLSPPKWNDPFYTSGKYPGCAGYYEQRRVFGGSTDEPDTAQYSQTGNHNNFTKSNPIRESDSIKTTLSAQEVNEIRHFVPVNDLIVLTSGSEWRINAGSDVGFSIETLKQKPQTTWGTSHLKPIVAGSTILFVQENKAKIRSLGFSLQVDGYTGSELSLLARHLFEDKTIVDWAYSKTPDSIIYMVRDDGVVLCLTFDQEQEVVAWTRWETDGFFESVCAVRPDTTTFEEPAYFVVRRNINGNVVRYIERTHSRFFDNVKDCFFVDSGLTSDNPIAITGITAANPVVVTCAGHDLVDGENVDIDDVVWEPVADDTGGLSQPEQLNGLRFLVNNVTPTTFELQDLDGNDIDGSEFQAYVSGGVFREPFANYTGADHLAGESIIALADGNVVRDITVASDGSFSLPFQASRVHAGIGYVSDVETLNPEPPRGSIQGRKKHIPSVTVKLEKSRGMLVGPTSTQLVEAKWREDEDYDDPTALLTGEKKVIIEANWNSTGRIFIRQKEPLPLSILSIILDIDVGDE